MKFVSKYSPYTLGIIDGTRRPEVTASGVTHYVENTPSFSAKFTQHALSQAEIESAKAQFLELQGPYAFGSVPGRDEGNINVQDALAEGYTGTAHQGYDVYQLLTSFDSSDPKQCPPDVRAEVEEFMLSHYEMGQAYVRVDNFTLVLPWPSYPAEGDVNVKQVVAFAKAGGLVEIALTFETARANRPDLVAALVAAQAEDQAARSEEAGLTARV